MKAAILLLAIALCGCTWHLITPMPPLPSVEPKVVPVIAELPTVTPTPSEEQ